MLLLALKRSKLLLIRFPASNKKISQATILISPSYILYRTNILLYIVLLSVFIIIYKYIIYLQTFNSIDFLQYFWIVDFIEDKDEEAGAENKGQGEEED